jgi:xanthine/CO dehydrogenase XdhC/CoxF family maturation factor/DNA-binding CsgD family transcriptional regulator
VVSAAGRLIDSADQTRFDTYAAVLRRHGEPIRTVATMTNKPGHTYGAVFVEVRVHRRYGNVRVMWAAGTPVGLATVVSTFGSAPRRPGSIMFRASGGAVTGSVSGGCVEGAVYELAQAVAEDGVAVLQRYGITDDEAGAVGLTCGGTIEVFVERVDRQTFAELGVFVDLARAGTPVALVTVVRPGGRVAAGRHLVIRAEVSRGSTGSPATDREVVDAARRLLGEGTTGTVRLPDGATAFVSCVVPPPRLLVYGSTDFAGASIRQGRPLGYRVTLCDARAVFATKERFPEADELIVSTGRTGVSAPAFWVQQVEAAAVEARRGIDPLVAQAAWATGSSMSIAQLVDLAINGSGPAGEDPIAVLTPRELAVARQVAKGLTNAQIGKELGISARTVATHLANIRARLGVDSRVEVALCVTRASGLAGERCDPARVHDGRPADRPERPGLYPAAIIEITANTPSGNPYKNSLSHQAVVSK